MCRKKAINKTKGRKWKYEKNGFKNAKENCKEAGNDLLCTRSKIRSKIRDRRKI